MLSKEIFEQIAVIHKHELKGKGFLSRCSISFISFFYKNISLETSTILVYDIQGECKITGFAFFTTDIKYMSAFFRKNLLKLMKYPSTYIPLVIHSFFFFFKYKSIDYNVELVQIAVSDKFKGLGIAMKLIKKAEKELLQQGIDYYYLQVHNKNISAIEFYKKNDFTLVTESNDKKIFKKLITK